MHCTSQNIWCPLSPASLAQATHYGCMTPFTPTQQSFGADSSTPREHSLQHPSGHSSLLKDPSWKPCGVQRLISLTAACREVSMADCRLRQVAGSQSSGHLPMDRRGTHPQFSVEYLLQIRFRLNCRHSMSLLRMCILGEVGNRFSLWLPKQTEALLHTLQRDLSIRQISIRLD